MTVALGDNLMSALDVAAGDTRYVGWAIVTTERRVHSVADFLADFPTQVDRTWTPDTDLGRAFDAARSSLEREEREDLYGPSDDYADILAFARDMVAQTLLLHGTYRGAQGSLSLFEGGRGTLEPAGLAVWGIPGVHRDHGVWVVADAQVDRDGARQWTRSCRAREVLTGAGFGAQFPPPMPRWPELTRGASVQRSLAARSVIGLVAWQEYLPVEDASLLADALRAAHCPLTDDDVQFGTSAETRATILRALEHLEPSTNVRTPGTEPVLPAPRLVKGAEAAEHYAAEVLRALGFSDAAVTRRGADSGLDVVADAAVAQVKMEALPSGRPALQALFGIASVEQKLPVFFSLAGYTAQALEWAERTGMACFEFAIDGAVEARSSTAREILREGAPTWSTDLSAGSGRAGVGRHAHDPRTV